jgi:signal transduction histidine kinase
VVAGGVSQAIARPIVQLTDFIRSHRKQGGLPPPPPSRSAEVGELRDAFVQMVHDIDQSQQKLARASALAAVGEMSAVIAHEIRTPLGIVHSSAQILQREAQLSSEGRELASFIESETTRLNRLVSSMLDAARPRPPRFAPADLNELVTHAVALLSAQATKQGVQFTTRLQASEPALSCDAEQLTQVLLNLILNGLQILAQGGRIEISTRDEGQQLFIDIADDGPGIAADVRERIFEAFFFQREGGVGLGLAVVQKIVLAHGGDVQAGASALGGALFSVRLPRQPTEPTLEAP